MRLVEDDAVTVAELTRRARATPHLSGMRRWGYVLVEPDPADSRPRPPERESAACEPGCRSSSTGLGSGLPEWLTGHCGGFVDGPVTGADELSGGLPLSALLSQPLHTFALEYERESKSSLNYASNVVRLLDRRGVRVS